MKPQEILAAAKAVSEKLNIDEDREAVEVLREKGYTWRETAAFLNERGVAVDHTRLYRHFGKPQEESINESREITISQVRFVGEKKKGDRKTWNVMEMELPTKLGCSIVVKGFTWTGTRELAKGADDSLTLRNPTLHIRSKSKGFPTAYLAVEIKLQNGEWVQQDVHIAPKWEELL